MFEKKTQPNILSKPKKRVKINEKAANTGNLEVNG